MKLNIGKEFVTMVSIMRKRMRKMEADLQKVRNELAAFKRSQRTRERLTR